MKFAKLTMMLNAVFLLVAISILAFFGLIPVFSIQISAICAVLAVITALMFRKHYRQDKAWLNEQED
ncbi:membrane protein implicated in regulation of membrane protease activity [Methanomicrobium sp. W14]|uniref:hypothetical protein n=1 Tax=Methanomicrobium sp. W14 TaxID=2817839 RepID=UPI001FD99B58|nr:hypothetical protein [Methanomicrobium sp. W14]MBP2133797.1 membrane protein implicated in regulation of membrane protease activity [Methanomicrobium sp. W14]